MTKPEGLKSLPFNHNRNYRIDGGPRMDIGDIGPRLVTILSNGDPDALSRIFTQNDCILGVLKLDDIRSFDEIRQRIQDPNINGLLVEVSRLKRRLDEKPTQVMELSSICREYGKCLIVDLANNTVEEAHWTILASDLVLESHVKKGLIQCHKSRTIYREE